MIRFRVQEEGEKKEFISVKEACEILGLHRSRVAQMCRMGLFKTAIKPGIGKKKNLHWRVDRFEVMKRSYNSHLWAINGQ